MKKILLVEDDRSIRRALEFGMKRDDITLLVAEDGEQGIETARRERPDLILLDLVLPKVNGFGVLKELKAHDETKDITIIVFSNLSQATDRDQVMALGAKDFLIKSNLSMDEVMDRVTKELGL